MLGSAAVTLMQGRLGNRTDSTLAAQLLLELQAAQARLELGGELPWFLEKQATSFSTVADTQTRAVPSDFLRELDAGLYGTDEDGNVVEIQKKPYRILRANNADYDTNDFPDFYDLLGTNLYFFPTPDAVYALEFWYYGQDTAPALAAENNWLKYAPELLIAEAVLPIARFLRDNGLVQLALSDVQRETNRLAIASVAYHEANASRYHNEAQ